MLQTVPYKTYTPTTSLFSRFIKVLKFKYLKTNLPDRKQKKLYKQDNSPSIKLLF